MLRLFSILFISVLLAFRPLIPVLDYVLNYDYIVSELCENRNEPELLCNGKCYLAKEISKTADENPSKQNPKNPTVKSIDAFVKEDFFKLPIIHFFLIDHQEFSIYLNHYSYYLISKLIKPPLT